MCGIVGIVSQSEDAFYNICNGLIMVQHRGQDSSGIVTYDGEKFREKKGQGLVRDIFSSQDGENLKGCIGIGHVRYPTAGANSLDETQPFFVNAPFGIYLIHNGNLTNTQKIREILDKEYYRYLRTNSDSEALLNILAEKIQKEVIKRNGNGVNDDVIFEAVKKVMNIAEGSYSVLTVIDNFGICAFRDPYGIRPLVLGKRIVNKKTEWMIASEDVAIKAVGFEVERDVEPGETILIKEDGELISRKFENKNIVHSPCIFEYIYLARPDSMLDKISVYKARLRMGSALAKQISRKLSEKELAEINSVIPIPESSCPVALQIAMDLGIRYREGFVKNRYIGRTFIMPDQKSRKKSIRLKLNPIDLEFHGRNILLVDDSIVRGNTLQNIVETCRKVGVKKLYVASAAPPIVNPCVYGVDFSSRNELVAGNKSISEIEKEFKIDKLFYQEINDLREAVVGKNSDIQNFCTGCFDKNYSEKSVTEDLLQQAERNRRKC